MQLRFALHPAQTVIHSSPARFKVVAAGRRFGKTVLAILECIIEALKEENDRGVPLADDSEVVYIGVTLEQAKRNAWNLLKDYARPVTAQRPGGGLHVHENTAVITLVNGVRIRMLGMDNPDAARGMKIRYAVLDEYADMPENVWAEIIRPALMDVKGGALFIGTPKGKNHFYKLFKSALLSDSDEWEAFNFTSKDNTTLPPDEVDGLADEYAAGSEDIHAQEIEAKFISRGGKLFHADQFKIDATEPREGTYYIAVDLAGFSTEAGRRNSEIKRRDETAIAIVKVHERGWWVKEIQHGRWDVRETALRIVKAAYDNEIAQVGIEKGALKNAVDPWLREYQNQLHGRWIDILPLTHGNRQKYDRVQWALQGRAQKGQITLNPGPWVDRLIDQAVDFPSRLAHDDLLDALSYIDQMAVLVRFDPDDMPDEYVPLDLVSGY